MLKEATASVISGELPPSLLLCWLGLGEGLPRLDLSNISLWKMLFQTELKISEVFFPLQVQTLIYFPLSFMASLDLSGIK